MTPGLRLVVAWLARVFAWVLVLYGVLLFVSAINVRSALWIGVGLAVMLVAWYVSALGLAEMRRQAAASSGGGLRGFEVVGLAAAKDKGEE